MTPLLKTFIAALGERHPSPKILDAIVEIGEGYVQTESPTPGEYYFCFFTRGVAFTFLFEQLTQITFYCSPTKNYKAFPFQIFEENQNRVDRKYIHGSFGSPAQTGGNE